MKAILLQAPRWGVILLRLGAGSELGPVRPLLEVRDAEDGPMKKWETLQCNDCRLNVY